MVTIPYWLIRYGLPAGFLLLATVAILVVRPVIHAEDGASVVRRHPPPPPTRAAAQRPTTRAPRSTGYAVRSGDTLATIAERLGTTVDELMVLNPGIDPHTLRVGQSLRVD
jgi:Tfp pilus assembly protein FimV